MRYSRFSLSYRDGSTATWKSTIVHRFVPRELRPKQTLQLNIVAWELKSPTYPRGALEQDAATMYLQCDIVSSFPLSFLL